MAITTAPTISATVEYPDATYRITNDLSTTDAYFRVYREGHAHISGILATTEKMEHALFALTTLRAQGDA